MANDCDEAVSTPSLHTKEPVPEWHPQEFQEFVPQGFGGEMVCPCSPRSVYSLYGPR